MSSPQRTQRRLSIRGFLSDEPLCPLWLIVWNMTSQLTSKRELYDQLASQLRSLLEGERDLVANAANFSSLVFHSLPDLNWAGFYFLRDGELVLGPFQGQPACVRIAMGKGVCGKAAAKRKTIVVPNVHEFPGHI